MQLYYVIHKNKVNPKIGKSNSFFKNFDIIKKVLEMFLVFIVMEHIEIKIN